MNCISGEDCHHMISDQTSTESFWICQDCGEWFMRVERDGDIYFMWVDLNRKF